MTRKINQNKKNDVIGIGNALMDILSQVKEEKILNFGLQKGMFNPVDSNKSNTIFDSLNKNDIKLVPGGSVANTLAGISNLGGKAIFYGKVGKDDHGDNYDKLTTQSGVTSKIIKGDGNTGTAITLITPDTQRTFAVNLGIATKLEHFELDIEDIKSSKVLHITGYQLEDPDIRKSVFHAMEIAKSENVLISLDVADPNLIKRAHADILEIIENYVDIVFANEEEAFGLMKSNPINALNKLSKLCSIVIVKYGKHGSFVKQGANVFHAEVCKANAIDTTGAGDMYAAGFLYGLCKGYDLEKCANIASYVASKVVEIIGARVPFSLKNDINKIF